MSNIIEGITKDLKAIPKNLKVKAGGMDTKKLVQITLKRNASSATAERLFHF